MSLLLCCYASEKDLILGAFISSIATAVPNFQVKQDLIVQFLASVMNLSLKDKQLLERIYKATGIDCRYSVIPDYNEHNKTLEFFPEQPQNTYPTTSERMGLYKKNALPLALKAVNECFSKNKEIYKSEITHIITVSCTGMYAPGLDIEIIDSIGLKPNTSRTAINFMGCYGAFSGMKVAAAFCKADPKAKVLLVCVELCSLHFQNELSKSNIISNAIFADGAAAVIIEGEKDLQHSVELCDFYSDIVPNTNKEMAWHIGDYGFEMILDSYVPKLIGAGISQFCETLLSKNMMTLEDINYFAIHPGGLNILKGCEEALSISDSKIKSSYNVLRQYGNMSSATFLFVLNDILSNTDRTNGANIFGCAFGPGLTMESVVMRAC